MVRLSLLCLLPTVSAFFVAPDARSSSTRLFISSWGTKGPPSKWATAENDNPLERIQAYLKEPEAVEARSTLEGTCLVSGILDQFILDLLNHQESAFEYDKLIALVEDPKVAKKQLLSRSARYTGLLDKLEVVQGSTLPTVEQLKDVQSWVAVVEQLSDVTEVAHLAKAASGLQNVAVLFTGATELDPSACQAAVHELSGNPKLAYTLVAVGNLEDRPEGKEAYQFREFGTKDGVLPKKTAFSKQEACRMVTELLQLECGKNKALSFAEVYNANVTEVKLIRGLREAGYARPQEIDHMIRDGPENYRTAIAEWKTKNPDGVTTDAWWEAEIYQKSRRDSAARDQAKEQLVADARTQEIEGIAKEWAKREYFRQSMAGSTTLSEEEFTKENWERAMFEGDLKYRQKMGEKTDADAELADFKALQERKAAAMLKKAKTELAEILDEDGLGGDDLKDKWDDEVPSTEK